MADTKGSPIKRNNIVKIVRVLIEDRRILENVEEFADHLDIHGSFITPLNQFRNNYITPYEFIKILLVHWVSEKGTEATMDTLISILKEMQCLSSAERLEMMNTEILPDEDVRAHMATFSDTSLSMKKDYPISAYIQRLAEILSTYPAFINQFTDIATRMGINVWDVQHLDEKIMKNEPMMDVFVCLLELWVSEEGQNATVNRLFEILRLDNLRNYKAIKEFLKTLDSPFATASSSSKPSESLLSFITQHMQPEQIEAQTAEVRNILIFESETATIQIPGNGTGYSYETVFDHFLTEDVRDIILQDSHITTEFQVNNFRNFLNMLITRCPRLERVTLKTNLDTTVERRQRQIDDLTEITEQARNNSEGSPIRVEIVTDRVPLHDRFLRLDNGWNIILGMGLDFYLYCSPGNARNPNEAYTDFSKRKCKETTITGTRPKPSLS